MTDPERPRSHREAAEQALAAGAPADAIAHALIAIADDLRELRRDLQKRPR